MISALDLGVLKLPAGGMQLALQLLKAISFHSDKTKYASSKSFSAAFLSFFFVVAFLSAHPHKLRP